MAGKGRLQNSFVVLYMGHEQGSDVGRNLSGHHGLDGIPAEQSVGLHHGFRRKVRNLQQGVGDVHIADGAAQPAERLQQHQPLLPGGLQGDFLLPCRQTAAPLQTLLQILLSPVHCCEAEPPSGHGVGILEVFLSGHELRQMSVSRGGYEAIPSEEVKFYPMGAAEGIAHPV